MAALPVIGAIASAGSAVFGGITAAENASYQGQVARNNATAARQNAAYSASAASANNEAAGLKAAQKLGNVTAAQAANNLDVNTGSAADVSTSQRELGQLDVDNTAQRGADAVYSYNTQAANFNAQAAADKSQVAPDIFGGILGAGASLAKTANKLPSGSGGAFSEFGGNSWTSGGGDGLGGPITPSLLSSATSLPSKFDWMGSSSGNYTGDWDN